jgi:hypothetical protein
VKLWRDEIYFAIPMSVGPEAEARETVEVGEVGYWPLGNALCHFFGIPDTLKYTLDPKARMSAWDLRPGRTWPCWIETP